MPAGDARGLVLVRLGASHRVTPWLRVPRGQRNWDLALSLYEDVDLGDGLVCEYVHRQAGGKWDGISAFFSAHPAALAQYGHFWLVDDDIEATPEQVEALFRYVADAGLEIAQPALTHDSYYSHRLTLVCPGFRHRLTNFVEIMMPVLSRHVLAQVLPWLGETRSGVGLDWLWYRFARSPRRTVAIIDGIPMAHRRPLNQHLRGRLRAAGIHHLEERRRMLADKGVKGHYPVAFSGVLADGSEATSRWGMAWRMTAGYWRARAGITRRPWRWPEFPGFFVLQVLRPERLIDLYRHGKALRRRMGGQPW